MKRSGDRSLQILLDPAIETVEPWSGTDLASMLAHQLSLPVPEGGGMPTSGDARRAGPIPLACTLGDVLERVRDEPTLLPVLRDLKDYAKRGMDGGAELPSELARVLYVLALTAVEPAARARISTMHARDVDREVRRCLTAGWLPDPVREQLRRALPPEGEQ